jgi:cytochrome c-type biogenesis protein CcmE
LNKYGKFSVLIVIIIGTLVWLATAGVGETSTYYKTIPELAAMGDSATAKRLRVVGDVVPGSIVRNGSEVEFVISGSEQTLKVVYRGTDPLPDTFRDRAEALADGRMGPDGVFVASKIQAKCASKYSAKPGEPYQPPTYGGTEASKY